MSATQHEAMAKDADKISTTHLTQYNPSAERSATRCGSGAGRASEGVCWTSSLNTTDEHRRTSEQFEKAAADHRAASQALRDVEARACVGISDADRDVSPFAHREDIASVEPLVTRTPSGKLFNEHTDGAVVTFRAVPGMTAQWLQREIDCHLARNSVLGHDDPEMAFCPLVPMGVSASVTATRDGFAVAIRANDSTTAAEVLKRARALRSSP